METYQVIINSNQMIILKILSSIAIITLVYLYDEFIVPSEKSRILSYIGIIIFIISYIWINY
jgi:hypothetical protein